MSNHTAAARPPVYPFAAIVGQEEMKLALILNAIEPRIGGALIMGHRGTGKSTAVRALADILPPIAKVKGCIYGCDPVCDTEGCDACLIRRDGRRRLSAERSPIPIVELPLGATEDRVCGSFDIERALCAGTVAFEPGLLARANRGFLYIDEVNLLEDHLVDLLLDVAASGRNIVEREGISVSHPARFVLVGSGNPEEGDLRPQLLDRFGLHAKIVTITDIDARVQIVRRRERFERDPLAFLAEIEPGQASLRRRLARARKLIAVATVDDALLARVGEVCLMLDVESHRGELTLMRSAKALAAFEGRQSATSEDVRRVAILALRHRLRRGAGGEVDAGIRITQVLDKVFPRAELKTNTAGHA
ncbi:MAG TPA: magnesium chelatase ATPase subunit I [Bryobacteraceae bacterium]|nr:magnesium chelatase ATPase subunit I [Bryobacteraceae bacterium]